MPQFFGAERLFPLVGRPRGLPAQAPERTRGAVIAVAAGLGFVMVGAVVALGVNLTLKSEAGQAARLSAAQDAPLPRMEPLVVPPAPGAIALATEDTAMPMDPLAEVVAAALAAQTATAETGATQTSTPSAPDCVDRLAATLKPVFIQFDLGSTEITAGQAKQLRQVSERIIACKDAYIMVAGHADSTGDDQLNMTLSWERADRTLDHLVALGVEVEVLEAVGFGARAPLSEGSNEPDTIDRRVEFRVLRRPENR